MLIALDTLRWYLKGAEVLGVSRKKSEEPVDSVASFGSFMVL